MHVKGASVLWEKGGEIKRERSERIELREETSSWQRNLFVFLLRQKYEEVSVSSF